MPAPATRNFGVYVLPIRIERFLTVQLRSVALKLQGGASRPTMRPAHDPGGGSTAHATSTRSSGVVIGSVRGFEHRGAFVGRHVDALHREFPSRDDGPDHVSAGRAAAASVLLLYRLGPLGPG